MQTFYLEDGRTVTVQSTIFNLFRTDVWRETGCGKLNERPDTLAHLLRFEGEPNLSKNKDFSEIKCVIQEKSAPTGSFDTNIFVLMKRESTLNDYYVDLLIESIDTKNTIHSCNLQINDEDVNIFEWDAELYSLMWEAIDQTVKKESKFTNREWLKKEIRNLFQKTKTES